VNNLELLYGIGGDETRRIYEAVKFDFDAAARAIQSRAGGHIWRKKEFQAVYYLNQFYGSEIKHSLKFYVENGFSFCKLEIKLMQPVPVEVVRIDSTTEDEENDNAETKDERSTDTESDDNAETEDERGTDTESDDNAEMDEERGTDTEGNDNTETDEDLGTDTEKMESEDSIEEMDIDNEPAPSRPRLNGNSSFIVQSKFNS